MSRVTVEVPATTANLGPGFDLLGMAVSLSNTFSATPADAFSADAFSIVVSPDSTVIPTSMPVDVQDNLLLQAYSAFFKQRQLPLIPAQFTLSLNVPFARGLGSSSTAIVAGLVLANALSQAAVSQDSLLAMAIEMEGHPDNVTPALLGGLHCCVPASISPCSSSRSIRYEWPAHWGLVFTIPPTPLSTERARRVLPETYALTDITQAQAALGMLTHAIAQADAALFAAAFSADTLHEPYRKPLIPEFEAVQQLGVHYQSLGTVISGAGSTMLTVTASLDAAERLREALLADPATAHCDTKVLRPQSDGARLL